MAGSFIIPSGGFIPQSNGAGGGGGGGGTPSSVGIQSFVYTADGSETTAGFPIPLQTPRSDNAYIAIVQLGGTAVDFTIQTPPAGYTTTQFTCIPGSNLTAGDVLLVLIVPTT